MLYSDIIKFSVASQLVSVKWKALLKIANDLTECSSHHHSKNERGSNKHYYL